MPALAKIPSWLQVYNKDICWKLPESNGNVYLTFDDGPHPLVTPMVLDILDEYKVKATFFCIGKNVELYPHIFNRILMEGHSVGNHSYSHKSGWKESNSDYFADVEKAAKLINSHLFRPPYGRITPAQFKLLKMNFRIIMWDVLSKDYDKNVSDESVIGNVLENVSMGSIIVMHDNDKTAQRMSKILPPILDGLKNKRCNLSTL